MKSAMDILIINRLCFVDVFLHSLAKVVDNR